MRALVQRVTEAEVTVAGEVVGAIGPGLLVLVCAMQGDDTARAEAMAAKVARLRIFRDDQDRMNLSLLDTGGAALVVSQFTLAAETRGNRPGFSAAAPPESLYVEGTGAFEFARTVSRLSEMRSADWADPRG